MKKTSFYLLAILMVITGLIVAAYSQEDMKSLDNGAFLNPQRTSSIFNHEEHNETAEIEDCSECHHIYEDGVRLEGESSEDQRCSECHDLDASGNTPGLMKAFHTNCRGCHISQKKGPVMCGECHLK
jgi:hypothetical protein